jgi:hypothetical protein
MLSGIRTGKKKRKIKANLDSNSNSNPEEAVQVQAQAQEQEEQGVGLHIPVQVGSSLDVDSNASENVSVAAKLKAALASGGGEALQQSFAASRPLDHLERRGRIQTGETTSAINTNTNTTSAIVVDATSKRIDKKEEDMTVQELAAQERQSKMSWDEQMTRNLARVGKKKRSRKSGGDGGSDEEVERLQRLLPGGEQSNNDKARQRDRHVQINQHQQQEKVTSKCSWWIESSAFSRHRLLALGNHISLVMAPPAASLQAGHHFYMVPLKHAKSFVDCDDDDAVWQEVHRFHDSLQKMYAKKGKGVILLETVLPNKGFWQTKIEAVPVPFAILQDAPIYFKSAMAEQTETWGTHNKLLKTALQKPLKTVIPKDFPYFSVFWSSISTSPSTGFAQIIEAANFRHDFGLDTLAGMMDLDPIRFQRKQKFSYKEERKSIADFLSSWKSVDWTVDLD